MSLSVLAAGAQLKAEGKEGKGPESLSLSLQAGSLSGCPGLMFHPGTITARGQEPAGCRRAMSTFKPQPPSWEQTEHQYSEADEDLRVTCHPNAEEGSLASICRSKTTCYEAHYLAGRFPSNGGFKLGQTASRLIPP